jgi:maltose O-acetyltransferase
MTGFAQRLLSELSQLVGNALSIWRVNIFRWSEGCRHQSLKIGARTRFHVPVCSGGEGNLLIGSNNVLGWRLAPRLGSGEILLQPRGVSAQVIIGNDNMFSNNVTFVAMGKITLGNGCLIGDQVTILDCDFHEIDPKHRNRSVGQICPIAIGNNVWLGSRAMILKGVSIGDNSVVGAMSVVTKSVPKNCVVAGNPAKVIRTIE